MELKFLKIPTPRPKYVAKNVEFNFLFSFYFFEFRIFLSKILRKGVKPKKIIFGSFIFKYTIIIGTNLRKKRNKSWKKPHVESKF